MTIELKVKSLYSFFQALCLITHVIMERTFLNYNDYEIIEDVPGQTSKLLNSSDVRKKEKKNTLDQPPSSQKEDKF